MSATAPADGRAVRVPPRCGARPLQARRQIQKVGDDLVRHHGKQRFYSVRQVREANQRQGIDFDLGCWSHAFFNSHADFDQLHAGAVASCDYAGMKAELTAALSAGGGGADSSWFDVDWDLSWLELPDLDWPLFDFFDL